MITILEWTIAITPFALVIGVQVWVLASEVTDILHVRRNRRR